MVLGEGNGTPMAVLPESASVHEVQLVEKTMAKRSPSPTRKQGNESRKRNEV